MAKVYEFLADGFEDIEALATVDVLRRGGVEVVTVSVHSTQRVVSAHGIAVEADCLFDQVTSFDDADMLLLPGGMPGAQHLYDHSGVRHALAAHDAKDGKIGAICAAPMVLGSLGIVNGKRATCYPGFEERLTGAECTSELVTVDGHITTGKGPAATLPYAYELLRQLAGEDISRQVARQMCYPCETQCT